MACLWHRVTLKLRLSAMRMRRLNNIIDIENSSFDQINSPVDTLSLIANHQGLCAILWANDLNLAENETTLNKLKRNKHHPVILQTKKQLTEYFLGKRKTFQLPLIFNGSVFQHQAWQALLAIPYGQTISYGEQAAKLGDKNKARAIGLANANNPISIIIPCHRVIGTNGQLTGFAGGLYKKKYLLALEEKYK